MKKEKGSVTLFVLISCMFMIVILLVVNIGVMNKNRSQEKELEEISKQYSQNETDLNNSYDEIIDENEYLTKNEILELIKEKDEYHVGDTCILNVTSGGYITDGGKSYVCNVYLDKKISGDVKSIIINKKPGVSIRQNNTYLLGSAAGTTTEGFSFDTVASSNNLSGNFIMLRITVSNENKNSTNNSPIGVTVDDLNITFGG